MESLGDRIYKLRNSAGMSQDALAEKLNISRQTVSRWETGTSRPTGRHIKSLCAIFGVNRDYFTTNVTVEEREELSVSKDGTIAGPERWKILLLAGMSVFLVLCITACCFAGYFTITPVNTAGLNERIVNRFRWVGIVCLTFGALSSASLIALWVIALKNRKKN